MININELLNLITEDIVINIMEEHGAPLHHTSIDGRTGQKILWFRTICHNGSSSKLAFYTESKDFYCYTSCGRMSFFDFIKRILNATDKEFYSKVIVYIASKVGRNLSRNRNEFNFQERRSLREEKQGFVANIESLENVNYLKENADKSLKTYDSDILKYFDNNTFYQGWIDEGISIPTMEKYGISWYEYQKYIIIPHYDMYNNLIGIRRRSLKPEDADNKYMPLFIEGRDYGHSLGLNLYGLNKNYQTISNQNEAIIVEGEKSVLQSDSFFGNKSATVATCGFNISQAQISLLKKAGVNRIFLGFDKDYDDRFEEIYKIDEDTYRGYLRYKERISTLGKRLAGEFAVYILKDDNNLLGIKDSPFDKGKDVFLNIKANAVKKHRVKLEFENERMLN